MLNSLYIKLPFVVLVVFLLESCSFIQTDPSAIKKINLEEHIKLLTHIENWAYEAKLSIYGKNLNPSTLLINWLHNINYQTLNITSTFGHNLAALSQYSNSATIFIESENQNFTGESIDDILDVNFNVQLPTQLIRYWMLGIPAPNLEHKLQTNADHTIQAIEQSGWHLEYSNYRLFGEYFLPKKIKAKNSDYNITIITRDFKTTAGK